MKLILKGWSLVLQTLALSIASPAFAEVVDITLLHLNDIYEITPVEAGRGGLARVATLRQQLLIKNPRTYRLLAGDAFSPSALGTAKVNGKPLAGEQMVAVMNAVGFNYATFGNHEFDLGEVTNDFCRLSAMTSAKTQRNDWSELMALLGNRRDDGIADKIKLASCGSKQK